MSKGYFCLCSTQRRIMRKYVQAGRNPPPLLFTTPSVKYTVIFRSLWSFCVSSESFLLCNCVSAPCACSETFSTVCFIQMMQFHATKSWVSFNFFCYMTSAAFVRHIHTTNTSVRISAVDSRSIRTNTNQLLLWRLLRVVQSCLWALHTTALRFGV